MPLNLENKYDVVATSQSYRDLRHTADDKTVLENPHKGWYYHYVDNSLKGPRYRDRVKRGEKFITKGLNTVYIRFDWGDIEYAGEGILDWSAIDEILEERGALGYKFSIRICTYEGYGINYATPKWVFDLGAGYTTVRYVSKDGTEREVIEPDYGDEIFLEKLDAFLAKCSEKFSSDPRIESVDVGTFGTWGEGHTGTGSNKIFPLSVLKKHINLHLKHFSDKTVILNDDFIEHASKTSIEDASALYDYCLSKGMGIRDDSICVDGYVKLFGFNTLRLPTIFENFAKNAPVDIEFCHIFHNIPERFKNGLPIIEALRTAHATYAGFHGYEDEWHAMSGYLSDYIANRLGYWFFIDGVDLGSPSSGTWEMATVYIRNNGYSKCYHKYGLKLRLTDKEGNHYPLNSDYPDATRWERDTLTKETLRLDYRGVPAGEYRFELGLFNGDEPIKLAIKNEYALDDGYYGLFDIKVDKL